MTNNTKIILKPVALPCGKDGSTRLYTINLFKGVCPHSCQYCYAQGFKSFSSGKPIPISIDSIKKRKKWPQRLFLSSASDPFHPEVVDLAEELLRISLDAGTFIVISTKALATPSILNIISKYPNQVSYTVSLSSLSEKRNSLLEPNAPNSKERLRGKAGKGQRVLCGIEQLTSKGIHVTLKADTLFPGIDDNEENISSLLKEAIDCGVRSATFSYAFYRNKFKKKLRRIPFIQKSLSEMSEYQPIASGMGYSLPLLKKKSRLADMARIAAEFGYEVISTCVCKNRIDSIPRDVPMLLECHFHGKWFKLSDGSLGRKKSI